MKKITFFTLFLLVANFIQAQNYQISFTASGLSTSIDSIQVLNLFKGTKLTINGSDVLHLVANVGVMDNKEIKDELIVYPNPMTEVANLKFNCNKACKGSVEIIDMNGKLILNKKQNFEQGYNNLEIMGLKSGSYFVKIEALGNKYVSNIVSLGRHSGVPSIKYKGVDFQQLNSGLYFKTTTNLIQMQYNNGDRLLLKAFSGQNKRIITMPFSQNKIVDFEFINCQDADGNHYAVTTINNQIWMAENLKTTKYNNGNTIPLVTDGLVWAGLTTPAYCWYENNFSTYGNVYGGLYNWFSVDSASNGGKNVCPLNWHVSTNAEWNSMALYIGGNLIAGGYLKETDTTHWHTPNTNATNFYGFTALPGGYRSYGNGGFGDVWYNGHWWTSTEQSQIPAYYFGISWSTADLNNGSGYKVIGKSVRCIKD